MKILNDTNKNIILIVSVLINLVFFFVMDEPQNRCDELQKKIDEEKSYSNWVEQELNLRRACFKDSSIDTLKYLEEIEDRIINLGLNVKNEDYKDYKRQQLVILNALNFMICFCKDDEDSELYSQVIEIIKNDRPQYESMVKATRLFSSYVKKYEKNKKKANFFGVFRIS